MYRLQMLSIFVLLLLIAVPLRVNAGGIPSDLSQEEKNSMEEAATEENKKTYYLDEIVTTATRIPRLLKFIPSTVTVVTRDQIEAAKPKDAGDILNNVAGLKVERYGATGANSSVHIRGLYSTHVLVMVDGRPVNSPSLGGADLSWLSVDNIEKVEIVRGAGSALYGANAVAGVVNIITKRPPEEITTKITASYGTWDTIISSLENGWSSDDFGYLLTANYKDTDGHRDNSAHDSKDLGAKVTYKFNEEMNLTISAGYYYGKTENPGTKPVEDFSMRTESQTVLGNDEVSSLFDYSKHKRIYLNTLFNTAHLKLNAYINHWDDRSHFEWVSSGERNIEDDDYTTKVYGGEIQYSTEPFKRNLITGGIGLKEEKFEVDSEVYNDLTDTSTSSEWDADRTTWAIFLEDEIDLEPVTLVMGARWDDPDDFESQTSIKVSALWSLGENTSLRASYGDSFRAPTLNDLNWPSDPSFQGNPDLDPEKGKTYEIGIEHSFKKNVLVRASLFRQYLKNMIAWAPTGPMGPWGNKWQPTNLNKAKIDGIEIESRIEFTEGLDLILSYTYLDGKQRNKELVNDLTKELNERERTLAYLPRHKIDIGLQHDDMCGINGLRLNLDAQYVSETYQYFQNWDAWPEVTMDTKEMPDYWLTDLKVSKEFKNTEIFLAVNNVFDEEYAIQFGSSINDGDYPMTGRSYTGGVKVTF